MVSVDGAARSDSLISVRNLNKVYRRGSETIEVSGVPRKVKVQRWYYKQGSRRLGRVVFVYRGKIAAIEVGGR